jgi:hypothetical protein
MRIGRERMLSGCRERYLKEKDAPAEWNGGSFWLRI